MIFNFEVAVALRISMERLLFLFPKPGELQRDATSSKVEQELRYQSLAFYPSLEHAERGIPV